MTHARWISRCLAVGPYPLNGEAELASAGITSILNVAGPIPEVFDRGRFRSVVSLPFEDLVPMPPELVREVVEILHWLLHESDDSKVYVHCSAGQNRSPTAIWLTLIAAGIDPDAAGELIGEAHFDANPGHPRLVPPDSGLIEVAQQLGAGLRFRADLLTPPEPR